MGTAARGGNLGCSSVLSDDLAYIFTQMSPEVLSPKTLMFGGFVFFLGVRKCLCDYGCKRVTVHMWRPEDSLRCQSLPLPCFSSLLFPWYAMLAGL